MKKIIIILTVILVSAPAFAGEVQISTYYPSPSGVYDRLQLFPHNTATQGSIDCMDNSNLGTLFYNFTPGDIDRADLMLCTASKTPSGGNAYKFMPLDGVWDKRSNNIFLAYMWDGSPEPDSGNVHRIGIGTVNPRARLELDGNSSILAFGNDPHFETGYILNTFDDDTPAFIWHPQKFAMRAGNTGNNPELSAEVTGLVWDNDNIGSNSVGFGYSPYAPGISSAAIGHNTGSIGNYSAALGYGTIAKSEDSLVAGRWNTLDETNQQLFALGNGTGTGAAGRNNAFTVFKNGQVLVNSSAQITGVMPHPILHVTGNMVVTRRITGAEIYSGTDKLTPDYVFEKDFDLESIEEHAEFMWENKHLKAVPGNKEIEENNNQVNLLGHNYGILEELEKAHIYIEQLNDRIKALEEKLGEKGI